MANEFINCPFCGRTILQASTTCKHCGKTISQSNNNNNNIDDIPAEISKQFNWGAFCLPPIWGIFNSVFIALIVIILKFIPGLIGSFIAFIFCIWLGINGNKLAWKARNWNSVEHFQTVQRRWATAGIAILILVLVVSFGAIIHKNNNNNTTSVENISTQNNQEKEYDEEENKAEQYTGNSNLSKEEVAQTSMSYIYLWIFTTGLENYCQDTGYVPTKSINSFKDKLSNTIAKVNVNYSQLSEADKNRAKNLAQTKGIELLNKQASRRASKEEYCRSLDENSFLYVNAWVQMYKSQNEKVIYLD